MKDEPNFGAAPGEVITPDRFRNKNFHPEVRETVTKPAKFPEPAPFTRDPNSTVPLMPEGAIGPDGKAVEPKK